MDIWKAYEQKRTTPEGIARRIESGSVCVTDIAVAEPVGIIRALGERVKAGEVTGLVHHNIFGIEPFDQYTPEAAFGQHVISWFSAGPARSAVNAGLGDVMPMYYRDAEQLWDQYLDVDVFYITVSPMDEKGYFSLGTVASYSDILMKKAKHIYLEVNQYCPRVLCGPVIHISQVEALCERNQPLWEMNPVEGDEISKIIGGLIAEEIPNEATLQIGVGAIPDEVGKALKNKRDLGIHTEMFTNGMVELLESGVVTNLAKPIHRGKSVATFALGNRKMYDYIHENRSFELRPASYVNDPKVIAMHPNFISVNSALEVDFFGQVCAESIGTYHMSGTGGQADFVRGAVESKGGKSFIAFSSTAKGGTMSRIRSTLTEGAVVSTGKNDVDCIVTEYGIARLRGKTLSQRTKALISIAHPDFRDELTYQAKKRNILI